MIKSFRLTISLFFMAVIVWLAQGQSNGVNIKCAPDDSTIYDESQVGKSGLNGTTLYYCNTYDKEYCHLNTLSPLYGECKSNATRFEFFPVQIALPGERCDPQRALYECGFGYKTCSAYRCLGFLESERCSVHQDCNPGLYCDTSLKTCQKIKSLDAQCQSSAECGRTAACIYVNPSDANGKCTQYMTVDSESTVYAKIEDDILVCSAGYGWLTTVSGSYEYKTGVDFEAGYYEGGKKVTSKNAGKECESISDCTSTEDSIYAKCGCSYGVDKSVCGILTGNSEWQDYFTALVEYYENTKDCHNAQDFQAVCTQDDLNDEKQCLKAQASHYLEYLNSPTGAKYYSNSYLFPEINEIEEWCNPDRKSRLLGINSSLLSQVTLSLFAVTLAVLYLI